MLRRPPRSTRTDTLFPYTTLFRSDSNPAKLDLGVGVYKDAQGLTPIPRAVKLAEQRLVDSEQTKSYIGGHGDAQFGALLLRQVLGSRAIALGEQRAGRSEEHTSELQSLMRNSYAVFCLKKKIKQENECKQSTHK